MNLKYILIVVILAAIVGGGILAYQFWLIPKEEAKIPGVKPPGVKPPEEVPIDETANWKTYRNEEIGIEFKYSDRFIEVFGMPYETRVGKEQEGKGIAILFGLPPQEGYFPIFPIFTFSAYTPNYEPPFYSRGAPFSYWRGIGDVTKVCPQPLKYEEGFVCKVIEVAQEKAIFEVLHYYYTAEELCGFEVVVFFNNPTPSPYKGLNFWLYLPDISDKVCKLVWAMAEGENLELESEYYSQLYSAVRNIMENKNLSPADRERLELFDQVLSTFRFLE